MSHAILARIFQQDLNDERKIAHIEHIFGNRKHSRMQTCVETCRVCLLRIMGLNLI